MNKALFSVLFFAALLMGGNAHAQLSKEALSKYFIDYYNFVLVGSQTPTNGFKVETNKPSITLKGNILSNEKKTIITNVELEGGLNDGLMQVFSANDLNPYFRAGIGINLLASNNVSSRYVITETERKLNNKALQTNKDFLAQQVDTFAVIKTITDNRDFETFEFKQLTDAVVAERKQDKYKITGYTAGYYSANDSARKAYFAVLIEKILIKYGADKIKRGQALLDDFRSRINAAGSSTSSNKIKAKNLLNDYDTIKESSLKDDSKTLNDKQCDFEIELTKFNRTWRIIKWYNFTLNGVGNGFRVYDNALLTKKNSLSIGVTGSRNWLYKGKAPSKFAYFRLGATVAHVNNTVELDRFNYKKETVVTVSPTEQLKTTEEGTAYQGPYREGVGVDAFFEGYLVPWSKEFVPGFYTKVVYRRSDAWINKNKVPVDVGLVWNVMSSDKEAKSLLTVVPYVSWLNIRQEFKDREGLQKRKIADLFAVNLRVGIPINIGK